MFENLPFAEDCRYFKTSAKTPKAQWIEDTERLIEELGGSVSLIAEGRESGRKALLIEFCVAEEKFRSVWPVLPVRTAGCELAAEIQAATMMFHDCKARSLRASIFGVRYAFFEFLLLPSGATVGTIALPELEKMAPKMLKA